MESRIMDLSLNCAMLRLQKRVKIRKNITTAHFLNARVYFIVRADFQFR